MGLFSDWFFKGTKPVATQPSSSNFPGLSISTEIAHNEIYNNASGTGYSNTTQFQVVLTTISELTVNGGIHKTFRLSILLFNRYCAILLDGRSAIHQLRRIEFHGLNSRGIPVKYFVQHRKCDNIGMLYNNALINAM